MILYFSGPHTSIVITYGIENSLTGERFTHVVGDPESGQTTISQNIVSGLNYVASALIVTNPDRLRIPTVELSTNTPTPQAQVSLDQHMADTLEVYNRVQADINRLRSSVQTIGTAVQAISINETVERQVVSVTADRANAAIISERQVRADAIEAVASNLDLLNAGLDTANAAIVQEQAARADAISAEANARQLALANVDTRIAEGYLDIQANVTPAGALASADIVLRASNDDGVDFTTVGQSFTLEPDGNGGFVGRIINRADMWSLVDEGGNLIFGATSIGGENLIVSNASIISPDGNFIIDPIRQILAFTT